MGSSSGSVDGLSKRDSGSAGNGSPALRPTASIEPRAGQLAAAALDVSLFSKCLDSGEAKSSVRADVAEAMKNDLTGSPEFIVNGIRLSGAHPVRSFRRLIQIEEMKF